MKPSWWLFFFFLISGILSVHSESNDFSKRQYVVKVNKTADWAKNTCKVPLCPNLSKDLCTKPSFVSVAFDSHLKNINKLLYKVGNYGDKPNDSDLCKLWDSWVTWMRGLTLNTNCASTFSYGRWCLPLSNSNNQYITASTSLPNCTAFFCSNNPSTNTTRVKCKYFLRDKGWREGECSAKSSSCYIPKCFAFSVPSGGKWAGEYAGDMNYYFGNRINATIGKRTKLVNNSKKTKLQNFIISLVRRGRMTSRRSQRQLIEADFCTSSDIACQYCSATSDGKPCIDEGYCCICSGALLVNWNY